jgi:ankyrin repeat protein
LIDAGCDINRKDANGQSCIFYAVAEGNLDIVKMLVERGANPLLTDKNKERPLHYARRKGHMRVA